MSLNYNNKILYEDGAYKVEIIFDHREPSLGGFQQTGYGVINKYSGVTENSTTILGEAIRWVRTLNQILDEALSPSKPVWPPKAADLN